MARCDEDQLAPIRERPAAKRFRKSMRREKGRKRTLDRERISSASLLELDLEHELFERRLSRMSHRLPRGRDVALRLEEKAEGDGNGAEIASGNDSLELGDALRQVGDPCSDGEAAAAVTTPGRRNRSLGEVRQEGANVVRLLELAIADLDEVGEVGADIGKELGGESSLTLEEAKERVFRAVLAGL
jgi:hypothetical protein